MTDVTLAVPQFGQHVFLASKSGALPVCSSPITDPWDCSYGHAK